MASGQHDFVGRTLREVLAPQPVPSSLERSNPHTAARLQAVLLAHVARQEVVKQQTLDHRIRAAECAREAQRDADVLDALGLSFESLSEGGKAHLFAAVLRMQQERRRLEQHVAQNAELRAQLDLKTRFYTARLEELRRAVADLDGAATSRDAEAKKQLQLLQYFASKKAEYAANADLCTAHLCSVGYEPALRHSCLVERCEAVKRETVPEQDVQFLQRFGDLEPDVELAGKRLQAAKEQLALLKRQYTAALQAMNVPE